MWEYNALEIIQDFAKEPLSMGTVRLFMDYFVLTMYDLPDSLRSANNLALVYSESDYCFSADDVAWLTCVSAVAMCRGEQRNLVFAEVETEKEEYYITCAAIVKLLNRGFPGHNHFIFRVAGALAFGCKRNFEQNIRNNFCVTQLFENEQLNDAVYFLEEALLSGEDTLPYMVMQYSPQERFFDRKFASHREVSADYICLLNEMSDLYAIDTSKEHERYIASFTLNECYPIQYVDACDALGTIGESKNISSYDILEDATQQEKTLHNVSEEKEKSEYNPDDCFEEYSEEAYLDAEVLLNEMLTRDMSAVN